MKTTLFAAVLGLGVLVSGAAFATDAAAPAVKPKPVPTATPMAAPAATPTAGAMKSDKAEMSAKSQECSKEADAKGLHGKERKHFREKCKKGEN
jgi:phosphate-selective porin